MSDGRTQRRRRVAVIGVGTEVGKTHVTVAVLEALARRGEMVVGLKPIESGVGEGLTDAAQLERVSTFHVKHPAPYRFEAALSPHLAARLAGRTIELDVVADWVGSSHATWTLVETAGGLLSPLSPTATNLDLVRRIAPDALVLVAADRLGVLHEVSACEVALRLLAPELPRAIIGLQEPVVPDGSTGSNARELVDLRIAAHVITFPRASSSDVLTRAAARRLLATLDPQPERPR